MPQTMACKALLQGSFAGGFASRRFEPIIIILQATNIVKCCHRLGRSWDTPKSLWRQKDFIAVILLLWVPRQFYSVVSSTTTAPNLKDLWCVVGTGLFPYFSGVLMINNGERQRINNLDTQVI